MSIMNPNKYLETEIFISLKNTYKHAVQSVPRRLVSKV